MTKISKFGTQLCIVLFLFFAILPFPAIAEGVDHIILFIGDGMHLEHEIATSRYLFGRDMALSFHKLPYQTYMTTWDVSAYNKWATALVRPPYGPTTIRPEVGYDPARGGYLPYPMQTLGIDYTYFIPPSAPDKPAKPLATDSASAATAWATGLKTDDGNLAWLPGDPENGRLETIAEILRKQRGFAIGVVSTVPFTHATPAAHVSHNVSRNNYWQIADEILTKVMPEVVIGGGHPIFNGSDGYMPSPLFNRMKAGQFQGEYVFVEREAGKDGAAAIKEGAKRAVEGRKRLFGLFGGPGGNFESPTPVDDKGNPHIERATIENPLLADTVEAALDVLSADPDGFFVMFEQGDIDWAAHANDFKRIVGTTWDLHTAVDAAIEYVNRPGDKMNWTNTLILVTADHANSYLRLKERLRAGELPVQEATTDANYPFDYPDGEVAFSTTQHTNELVSIYAFGRGMGELKRQEGEWYPCTRLLDNTQLFGAMLNATGVANTYPGLTVIPDDRACDVPMRRWRRR